MQRRTNLRRVIRVVQRHRRHHQCVTSEHITHQRRLFWRLHTVDPQPRVRLDYAIDRNHRQAVDLLKLHIQRVSLQQRINAMFTAEIDCRRDRPDGVGAVIKGELVFFAVLV